MVQRNQATGAAVARDEQAGPANHSVGERWWRGRGRIPACAITALGIAAASAIALRTILEPPLPVAAQVGARAPDFDLPVGGRPSDRVKLSALRGHAVVVVFNCGCKACTDFDQAMASHASRLRGARVMAIASDPTAFTGKKLQSFRRTTGFRWPVLLDEQMNTTLGYRSTDCPRVWLIDPEGVIRYADSDKSGTSEARAQALAHAFGKLYPSNSRSETL